MEIGNNLRTIREKKNYSQQEVADFINIDRKTYINWESGKTDIKSSFIPKLAEFFKADIKEFFKEKTSSIVINQHNLDNTDYSINSVIILLNDKEILNNLVQVIKKKYNQIQS